jgi:uncharacterized protein YoxC
MAFRIVRLRLRHRLCPQRSRSVASTELEQLRRPVEHLIKLASVREDRMSRQREIFGLRSGELSTFSSDAARETKFVQDQMELVKLQAEEMRAQADQMLQEANKTREMADRLIASVDTLTVDVPNARKRVDHLVERSEQMSSFMRKNFDWLAALRVREQEKVDAIQAELKQQALAEINRLAKEQEMERQLERQKAEAQERENAARKRRRNAKLPRRRPKNRKKLLGRKHTRRSAQPSWHRSEGPLKNRHNLFKLNGREDSLMPLEADPLHHLLFSRSRRITLTMLGPRLLFPCRLLLMVPHAHPLESKALWRTLHHSPNLHRHPIKPELYKHPFVLSLRKPRSGVQLTRTRH